MRSCCFIFIAGVLLLSLTVAIPVAAAIQANGTISVVSQGWVPAGGATVSIDGVPAGTIPPALTVTVPAGTHMVSASGQGSTTWTKRVIVRKGSTVKVVPALEPGFGTVSVVSDPPGAELFLDGAKAGSTPWNSSAVAKGSHLLLLRMPGHQDATRYFIMKPPRSVTVSIKLREVPPPTPTPTRTPSPAESGLGSLVIRTPEDGYEISLRSLFYDRSMPILDGKWHYQIGRTPAYWMDAVPQGTYDLIVTAPGNLSQVVWSGTAVVRAGGETVIDTARSSGNCPWGLWPCL